MGVNLNKAGKPGDIPPIAAARKAGRAGAAKRTLPDATFGRIKRAMTGFIYFNITDHARLPARFFGMTRSVLARL